MVRTVYEPYIRACLGTAAHFCDTVVLKLRTVQIAWTCPIGSDPEYSHALQSQVHCSPDFFISQRWPHFVARIANWSANWLAGFLSPKFQGRLNLAKNGRPRSIMVVYQDPLDVLVGRVGSWMSPPRQERAPRVENSSTVFGVRASGSWLLVCAHPQHPEAARVGFPRTEPPPFSLSLALSLSLPPLSRSPSLSLSRSPSISLCLSISPSLSPAP